MTVIDDGDCRLVVRRQKPRDDLNGPDRRRKTDSLRPGSARFLDEIVEASKRQREMGAPLVIGDRVDLVDDDRADVTERLPAAAQLSTGCRATPGSSREYAAAA